MSQENPGYIQAMREIRRSSAASPHVNKARQAKRGIVKGGRARFNKGAHYEH